jgi:hypothetical protein
MDSAGGSPSRATLAARAFGVHTRLPRACAARRITDRWHAGSTARRIPYSEIRFTRRATDSDVSSRKGRKSVVHQLVARKRSFCGERLAGGLLVEGRSRCGESGPRHTRSRSRSSKTRPPQRDRPCGPDAPRPTSESYSRPPGGADVGTTSDRLSRSLASRRGRRSLPAVRPSAYRRVHAEQRSGFRLRDGPRVSLALSWNACRFGTERRPCVRQRRVREPLSEPQRWLLEGTVERSVAQ